MDLLAALLDACRERPDDDLPRRVLGDWLMDQEDAASQARGEFVHIQLDLAAGKRGGRGRHDELLEANREEWLGPLAGLSATFWRGMVAVRVDHTHHAPFGRLLERGPPPAWGWVSELLLRGVNARQIHRLADWPGLDGVAVLRVHHPDTVAQDGDGWLQSLAHSPHFHPETLYLQDCESRYQLPALILMSVPVLSLRHCNLTDADVASLRDAPLLPRLRSLSLPDNHLHAETAEALATCPGLTGLKALNLGRNVISAEGARRLGHATHLDALEELDLRLNGIRDEGAMALYRSPLGARLRRLNLVSNGVMSAEVQRLWRGRLGGGVEF